MLTKHLFFLILFSFPIYGSVNPNEFIENYINDEGFGNIYKIDLLIFKNEFIDEEDLKEKWNALEPLELSDTLFMIKDQPTLLVKKPIFEENNQSNLIEIKIESLNIEIEEGAVENKKTDDSQKVKFNLFERILYEKGFEEIKMRLDKNNDYEVLHSISWYQPLVEKEQSASIFVDKANGQIKTYGEILIYKDRFLHFDAKLRLSKKTNFKVDEYPTIKIIDFNQVLASKSQKNNVAINESYWVKTIFNNIKVNVGDFSNWIKNNEVNDYSLDLISEQSSKFKYDDLYEIDQEIKVEENKYHFIDHPYFGIIVRISPL